MTQTFAEYVAEKEEVIRNLRQQNAQLLEALEILCKEVRRAHIDSNHIVPGCLVCEALYHGEEALAAAKGGGE
jgi:hypothetical protein